MRALKALSLLVLAIVRELADESAYARHLAAIGTPHSKEEWQAFQNCRLERKFRGGRCC